MDNRVLAPGPFAEVLKNAIDVCPVEKLGYAGGRLGALAAKGKAAALTRGEDGRSPDRDINKTTNDDIPGVSPAQKQAESEA